MPTAQSILSDDEYELLKTEAKDNNLTISQYLREVLTEQGIVKRKGLNALPAPTIRTEEERYQEQSNDETELSVVTTEPDIDSEDRELTNKEANDFNFLNEKIELLKSEKDELNNDFGMLKQDLDDLKNGYNFLIIELEALIDEFNEVKPITHEMVIDYIENHEDELKTFIKIVKINQMIKYENDANNTGG